MRYFLIRRILVMFLYTNIQHHDTESSKHKGGYKRKEEECTSPNTCITYEKENTKRRDIQHEEKGRKANITEVVGHPNPQRTAHITAGNFPLRNYNGQNSFT